MALRPRTRLAQYEILASIGAGGMGEVYRARDTKLGRDVAIKVLPEAFSSDRDRRQRFEREAKLLASLNHPAIATLHDFVESDGVHFLVMELIDGVTLAERLGSGPLAVTEALPLFVQIAEGLEAAHEHGVLHRDLKPANVLVTRDGKAKILDFGLGRQIDQGQPTDLAESPTRTRGTDAGIILGTAPYMSPEQAKGLTTDRRADVWALGCVLYETLSGKSPFRRDTVTETLAAILSAEPDWSALPKNVPSGLVDLLQRCLRKSVRDRWQHVGDARIALQDAARAPTVPAPAETALRQPVLVVAMAAATVCAIGIALWALTRPHDLPRTEVTRTVIPLARGESFALGFDGSLALSPDGRTVAFVTGVGSKSKLYLRRLDALQPVLVTEGSGVGMPFFSPDGERVGFLMGDRLWSIPAHGGAPTAIELGPSARGASWTVNGVVTTSPRGLVRLHQGETETLSTVNRALREKHHRFPDALPAGDAVLFTLGTIDIDSWDEAALAVLSLETGEHRIVLEGGMSGRFSASGHVVYARAGSLWAVPFDLSRLEVTGAPVEVVDGVSMSHVGGSAEFGLSRKGTLVYAPGDMWGAERRVVWIDRQGKVEPLIEERRSYSDLELSPDGGALALTITAANDSIWVYDLARGTLTRAIYGADNLYPTWSPTGDRIAFSSTREGFYNLFVQPVEAAGPAVPLAKAEATQTSGSWSRVEDSIVFQQGGDIWMVAVGSEKGALRLLGEDFLERYPRLSPHGRFMAYASNESGREEVYVRSFPDMGSKQQVSAGGGTDPFWHPNGSEIYYRTGDALMAVTVMAQGSSLRLGMPLLLFERPSVSTLTLAANRYSFRLYDITPDGRHFVTLEEVETEPPPTHLVVVQNFDQELKRLVPH